MERIGPFAAGVHGGQRRRWSYYLDGVRATAPPARTPVPSGTAVWWDLHDAGAAATAAVVGSYPEPFVSGLQGKRLPVRLECGPGAGAACDAVAARLRAAGVLAARATPGSGGGAEILRVLVGPWAAVRADPAAALLIGGPRASGVFARFDAAAALLTLGRDGAPVRRLAAPAGLIAATRPAGEAPVWIVTGTDQAGVLLAARALDAAHLHGRFAVAVRRQGTLALPDRSGALQDRSGALPR